MKINRIKNPIRSKETKFFKYRQNNSGGDFVFNEYLTILLFIEAHDYVEANYIAESLGLYFDGVESEIDCPCCGDRWNQIYSGYNGETLDSVYEEIKTHKASSMFLKEGYPDARIFFLNGEVEEIFL